MMLSPAESYFQKNYLWPEETIKWRGYPGRARSMAFNWWFTIVGWAMCIFLFMLWRASPEITDVRLPEVVLVLFALWLALTPLRYALRARRTAYFVTDKRAVILEKGLRIRETVFNPDAITDYKLIRRGGDRGDIRLRLSQTRTKTAYQEDKEKWIPGLTGGNVSWSGVAPFVSFNDGFWGITEISMAATALTDLVNSADRGAKY
ncbi:MAG: hypothetical protein COB93_09525 [Sneathiella sp.]|nr:MAG: hypothetical protein COB93_09525 [Sneathiella sp.]